MSALITYRPAPNINAVFTYTGADQTYVVPAGITTMTVTLWGAGGGSSISPAGGGNQIGGAGACLTGSLLVTPGETLTIIVGQAGCNHTVSTGTRYGGGGAPGGGPDRGYSSSGGGRSAIRRSTTDVVTVGAGGGGRQGTPGGAGGITTGGAGTNNATGGTQSAGGGGNNQGSLYTGANGAQDNSAGGGAGYYGGGAGGQDQNGGGGSSLYSNLLSYTGYTSATGVAPNNTSPLYVTGVGNGGTFAGGGTGGNGLVVLSVSNLAAPPLQITLGNVLSSTATAFIADGATYTIPPKTSKVRIFVWGGGGNGSGYGSAGCGGSGAHVQGDFTVGGITSLTIYLNRGAGNGNFGNNGAGYGAVYNATTGYLLIAGGGGGSGSGYGGGAGYLQGFNGGSPSIAGQVSVQSTAALGSGGGGGSQTQGGDAAPSAQAGSYLQGGNSEGSGYPSAGGGGYYGGGGGNGNGAAGTRSGNGPGGGGSSYINLSYITNYKGFDGQSGSTVSVLPGGASSPYYVAGYGVGGRLTSGGGALVVIVPYLSGGGGATSSTAPAQITLGSSSTRALGGVTTIYNTYKIHTFASPGTATFTVTPPNALTVKVLVVGGGGGGGATTNLYGGGGGAGGLVYSRTMSLTPGTYQVVVGAGGPTDTVGGNSTFNGLVAYGGGYGGASTTAGGNGGCGGGGGGVLSSVGGTGSQGFGGSQGNAQNVGGGGGGGMGAGGATGRPLAGAGTNGFRGGDGAQVQITGTPTYYAGGGGGGGGNGVSGGAVGGEGGGGTGGGTTTATAGTAGLGGGGGCGAAGGCGTVIMAYLLPGQIDTVTTPTVIAGLIFWMDGADPAGTGVLPANGASITTWVDKSGNGKNATASAAATYSLASKALVFTGAQYYTTPFTTVPTTISVFLVINIGGGGYMDMMAGVLQVISNGYSQHLTIPGGSTVVDGTTMAAGTTLLYNFTFDSSASAYMYYNGALTGTRNGSTSYTGSGSIVLGSSDGVHEAYTGTISEILIYNSVLSTTNRQKIEGYLAWKWGFASNLSASNPYKYDSPM